MIHYLEISNFHSIEEEQILDFTLNMEKTPKFRAQPVIGLAGSNASGKTNVLRAFGFIKWFILHSFDGLNKEENFPFTTFLGSEKKKTCFHIIFDVNSVEYGYKLELKENSVLFENLYLIIHDEIRDIYIRNENDVTFDDEFKLEKKHLKDLRSNSGLIQYLSKFDTQIHAQNIWTFFNSLFCNVTQSGLTELKLTKMGIEKLLSRYSDKLLELLGLADIGIKGIVLPVVDRKSLINVAEKSSNVPSEFLSMIKNPEFNLNIPPIFYHQINGEEKQLGMEHQSSGTLQLLALLFDIFEALENGTVLILDEFELKLHPYIVAFFIGVFQNPYENIKGGQLIFSFHNSSFMELLSPEQLWFTEKKESGSTELFSAEQFSGDIKDLHHHNLQKLYNAGRFGAVPQIGFVNKNIAVSK